MLQVWWYPISGYEYNIVPVSERRTDLLDLRTQNLLESFYPLYSAFANKKYLFKALNRYETKIDRRL